MHMIFNVKKVFQTLSVVALTFNYNAWRQSEVYLCEFDASQANAMRLSLKKANRKSKQNNKNKQLL